MRVGGGLAHAALSVTACLLLIAAQARTALAFPIEPPANIRDAGAVAKQLAPCFVGGREVLLLPDKKWQCVDKGAGAKEYKKIESAKFNPAVACQLGDQRRMPTGIINQIVEALKTTSANIENPERRLAIRIIGGAFCQDEMNLSDLDLPYPLVLDYGVFKFGIRADNFRTAGFFSVDSAFIYDNLALSGRSRIGGSIFANDTFIQSLRIVDTDVGQAASFNRSVLTKFAIFDRVTVLGGISMSDAALSTLIVRNSKVGERLSLNGTEAQCRYDIRNNEFAEFFADNSGFGVAVPPAKNKNRDWSAGLRDRLKRILTSPAVAAAFKDTQSCITDDAEFLMIDNTIRSACLRQFRWPGAQGDTPLPRGIISFDGTRVSRTLNINLWEKGAKPAKVASDRRVLQLQGTEAGTLIFDFADNAHPYDAYIDRLQINSVQGGDVACAAQQSGGLPSVRLVSQWLERNKAPTTQPFLAFADAFQRAGADPTDLRVAKASLDFSSDWRAKLTEMKAVFTSEGPSGWASYLLSIDRVVDGLRLTINSIVGYVADFGYRPYKSILVVAILILFFWLWIWKRLRVAYAMSEVQNKKFYLGPYFIFDYMIPLYSIDPAHAKIADYYFADGQPLDPATRDRLDRVLWWVRVVGLGAVVFLSATLKASVVS